MRLDVERFCGWKLFLVIFAVIFQYGCSDWRNGDSADPAKVLEIRAKERWDGLINKDWGKAYSYELPAYRETHDLERFKGRFGSAVQWKKVNIETVELGKDGQTASVQVAMTYQLLMPGSGRVIDATTEFKERWLKEDSNWWFVP